jgi:hypothetical protein
MTYESICAENKKLYAQLEGLTYALMELDQVKDAGQYNLLLNEREYVHSQINSNLEYLELFMPKTNYRAAKRSKQDMFKDKVVKHYKKHHSSLKEMSGVFGISVYQVSRYITEHLSQKFC